VFTAFEVYRIYATASVQIFALCAEGCSYWSKIIGGASFF
jgi:hypothetical protein